MERQETEIEVEQEEVVPMLAPGGGKLPCKYCDKAYTTKFSWQRHVREKHGITDHEELEAVGNTIQICEFCKR